MPLVVVVVVVVVVIVVELLWIRAGGTSRGRAESFMSAAQSPARQRTPSPKSGAAARRTPFRRCFDEQILPIRLEPLENGMGMKLVWTQPIAELDLHHVLPIFFSGVIETQDPYQFAAVDGLFQLLETSTAQQLVPVVAQLVQPIKDCLNTKNTTVICNALRAIQQLAVSGSCVVAELAKGYHKFLPAFNILRVKRGKGSSGTAVANLVDETLEVLEMNGDEVQYRDLRKMIPNYESCMLYSAS